MKQQQFVVGLTGGVASGKTTVANAFADLGIPLVDADVIARRVVEPGRPELQEIVEVFGDEALMPDGNLDRARMRKTIFNDADAKQQLEDILHPAIRREIAAAISDAEGDYVLLVSPLLVEMNMLKNVQRVLVIDVPEHEQMARLCARDDIDTNLAEKMIAGQISRQDRLAAADDVFDNNRPLASIAGRVQLLHQDYLKRAGDFAGQN